MNSGRELAGGNGVGGGEGIGDSGAGGGEGIGDSSAGGGDGSGGTGEDEVVEARLRRVSIDS